MKNKAREIAMPASSVPPKKPKLHRVEVRLNLYMDERVTKTDMRMLLRDYLTNASTSRIERSGKVVFAKVGRLTIGDIDLGDS